MLVSPSFLSSSFILTLFPNQKQNCYRNSLQLLVENNGQSIAFSVINSEKRGYPPENGVHIAIRNTTDLPLLSWHLPLPILSFSSAGTVRRFLERYGQPINTVVFCMENDRDYGLYVYFHFGSK